MDYRGSFNGNGESKGLIDVSPVGEGCSLFGANPTQPPPDGDMPFALSEVLQKWLVAYPVKVRATLPIIKNGNLIGMFVWWDRVGE